MKSLWAPMPRRSGQPLCFMLQVYAVRAGVQSLWISNCTAAPRSTQRGDIRLDTAVLASIAHQMMSSNTVDVNGKPVPVRRRKHVRAAVVYLLLGISVSKMTYSSRAD